MSHVQGTHSGQPVKLYVHIKDSRGKRIKTGGDDVAVRVQVRYRYQMLRGWWTANSMCRRILSCCGHSSMLLTYDFLLIAGSGVCSHLHTGLHCRQ
jgi:hypothetical protein